MAKSNHDLLWIALAGGAGFVGYRAWKAHQDALAAAGVSAGGFSFPPMSSMVSGPSGGVVTGGSTSLVPGQIAPIYSSNPSLQYPGVIGQCMARKGNTWSAAQCQSRLSQMIAAYANAKQAVANLTANTVNPAAAGIPAAQAQMAVYDQKITEYQGIVDAANARGDTAASGIYTPALSALKTDRAQIAARIAAAQAPNDNAAAIAAWQGSMAALDKDFQALTGASIVGAAL